MGEQDAVTSGSERLETDATRHPKSHGQKTKLKARGPLADGYEPTRGDRSPRSRTSVFLPLQLLMLRCSGRLQRRWTSVTAEGPWEMLKPLVGNLRVSSASTQTHMLRGDCIADQPSVSL